MPRRGFGAGEWRGLQIARSHALDPVAALLSKEQVLKSGEEEVKRLGLQKLHESPGDAAEILLRLCIWWNTQDMP